MTHRKSSVPHKLVDRPMAARTAARSTKQISNKGANKGKKVKAKKATNETLKKMAETIIGLVMQAASLNPGEAEKVREICSKMLRNK